MPTTPELDSREARAWQTYQRMQSQLAARISRDLAQGTGLSEADHAVLRALLGTRDHRLRLKTLREALQWEKSRLSHHIARMERRGMVERVACEDDSRGFDVRLTDHGRDAISEACAEHTRIVREHLLGALTADQLDSLTLIGETVLRGLDHDESGNAATYRAR